jgi:ferredoxin
VTIERASWRLELDGTTCNGHGICTLCCPTKISLDEWGFAIVDSEPITGRRELAQARRAVAACPAGALRVTAVHRSPVRLVAPRNA